MHEVKLLNIRVLVVDSDRFMLRILGSILAAFEVGKVAHANSFDEAREALNSLDYDCVFTDWVYDASCYCSLTQYIRQSPSCNTPNIPIVLCTAHTHLDQVRAARDDGVSEMIMKPISPAEVLEKLVAAVFHRRDFITAENYAGPDRRRIQREWSGVERRRNAKLQQGDIDALIRQTAKRA